MGFLRENKKIFVIAGIIFIVLFILIFLLGTLGNGSRDGFLKCSKNVITEDGDINQTIIISNYTDYRTVELITSFPMDKNIKENYDEYSELVYSQLESKVLSIFGENAKDVSISMKKKKSSVDVSIKVSVNESNNGNLYELLEYDFFNTSIEDLRSNMESSGLICN